MKFDGNTGEWVLFVGPLRVRWVGRDFRPLYSERVGHRKWYGVGRLHARFDFGGAA